ncbi:MAG TPA: hypothetical protein VNP95_05850, partial [Thermomicrobiales bacterium]|nr:hypothetical protein [Thermomicrobiales bacterium]
MTDADRYRDLDHNPNDHLERALAAIGDEAAFPDTPDLAARIGGMLPDRPERIVDIHPARPRYRLIAAAALLIVLLGIGAMLAVPTARESVARWLHVDLPGLRIEVLDPDDAPRSSPPSSLGGSLLLGTPTTLADAALLAPAPLQLPSDPALGNPSEVWQRDGGTVVTLLYPASGTLPEIGETGVGLAFMQIVAPDGPILFAKQSIGSGGLEQVSVNGLEGFWVTNGRLVLQPADPLAIDSPPASSRWSGNVLIWSDGAGTTFRIESMLDRATVIRIAGTLAPVSAGLGNARGLPRVWGVSEMQEPDGMAFGVLHLLPEVPHASSSHRRPARHRACPRRDRPGFRRRVRAGEARLAGRGHRGWETGRGRTPGARSRSGGPCRDDVSSVDHHRAAPRNGRRGDCRRTAGRRLADVSGFHHLSANRGVVVERDRRRLRPAEPATHAGGARECEGRGA